MRRLLPYADVLIANEEDAEKVLGIKAGNTDVTTGKLDSEGYIDVAGQISKEFGIPYIATTLRKSISASVNDWSALLYHNGKTYFSKNYTIQIVNRVGGGDSFAGGLIYAMRSGMKDREVLEFAAAASCLKHSIEMDFNLVSVDQTANLMNGVRRFHDLRHTFATMALEHGMDIKTLSAIIGHASSSTTVHINYPHTSDYLKVKAA